MVESFVVSKLFWVSWVITVITFILGIVISLNLKKKDRLYSLFDSYNDSVKNIEDEAIEFWLSGLDESFRIQQLALRIARLNKISKRITVISSKYSAPKSADYIAFKQAVTLYVSKESESNRSQRISKIIHLSSSLQEHYPILI